MNDFKNRDPEKLDHSFLIQHIRDTSCFDADLLQYVIDEWKAYRATGASVEDIQKIADVLRDLSADIPKEIEGWLERCTWHVRRCTDLQRECIALRDEKQLMTNQISALFDVIPKTCSTCQHNEEPLNLLCTECVCRTKMSPTNWELAGKFAQAKPLRVTFIINDGVVSDILKTCGSAVIADYIYIDRDAEDREEQEQAARDLYADSEMESVY